MEKKKINWFRNAVPTMKIYGCLLCIREEQKGIRKARAAGDLEKEREYIRRACVKWSNKLMSIFGLEVNVKGRENLPTEGPVVFVANHQSYADIPVCSGIIDTIQMGYVAKADLSRIPIYKNWIKDIRSVMILRDHPRESLKAIQEGIELIEQGFSLMIFPEGTRSHGGPMKPFKKGSLRLATKPGVPIVPITISGTYRCFETQGYFKGDKVDVIIHPAIPTKDLDKHQQTELLEQVEQQISNSLAELEQKTEQDCD